ncbi:NifU -like protein involved in Fe-S cluster formation [Methanonatronarchaeum thermophilum]|uniref:NifU-like protein involved in Fe-S cluster formation n=1 Tax=Methanonatronarchaeum thermophilum TaxID=1927129 RepID=A0A1Y3GAT1_9EURY|nr:iron-sulfur cluster assembly scaffold protein [Methanonatronarchaeum thermophilum]OUJ18519.1 NifU -like protein involved in Fe-S cluster formation [Methanonatronarchaeum thermophilum]
MYSDKVMEHFKNPKNMGEMENPDITAKVGNPACGDLMQVYLKIEEKNNEKYIEDISFKTFGCAAAIATSSVTTELVKGKTLKEAEKLTRDDVAEELGGLPKVKMHCSNLAANGVHRAIYEYKKKNNMEISQELEKKYKTSEAALEKTEEKMDQK